MARFSGKVGYGESVTTAGVTELVITEYPYQGDVVRNARNLEQGAKVLGDVTVSNTISIVADEHAAKHFFKIQYVSWEGVRWIVTNVEVRPPRLILSLGSVYNGPIPVVEEDDEPP